MPCIADTSMVDLLEGRMDESEARSLYAHLDECAACRSLLAGAAMALDDGAEAEEPGGDRPSDPSVDAEALATPLSTLKAGEEVDHFQVIRLLGRGGMGEVYLAHDRSLDRRVALKVIKASLLTSEKAKERFGVEARATARLNHPNIVTIHAIGEHAGRPYVALELLEGQPLAMSLSQRLSLAEAVRIGRAIAEALAAAHAAGVFHRDLKPANIMLGSSGRVSVLDFGLAQLAAPDQSDAHQALLLRSMQMGGTPVYMAPEQWRREPSTGATDVWALGVLLHEMCLGRRPFGDVEGCSDETIVDPAAQLKAIGARVCSASALSPARLRAAGMPDWLANLVARCLDPDSSRRPSARDVAEQLASIRVSSPPPKPRRSWMLAVALLIGLTALGIGSGARSDPSDGAPAPSKELPALSDAEHVPNGATAELPTASRPLAPSAVPANLAPVEKSEPASPPSSKPVAAPIPTGVAPPKKEEPWDPMRYR